MATQIATATTVKIYPTDDSLVRSSHTSTNYGTIDLRAGYQSSIGTDRSYLKFDLSPVQGKTITSATFSIEPNNNEGNAVVDLFYVSDDSWNEETVKWNSKPSYSTKIGSNTVTSKDRIFYDVKSYASEPTLSFAMVENGEDDFAQFWSKEYNTGSADDNVRWPYIEVTYDGSATCNTAADTNCNGCVSLSEMVNLMLKYKQGTSGITLAQMVNIMLRYKQGQITC